MDNEIEGIVPPKFPFGMDCKIFRFFDEETQEPIGDPYSVNDWLQMIKDKSGVGPDLLGTMDATVSKKEKDDANSRQD